MTTFARLIGGFAYDCRVHASATELAACFNPEWLSANLFAVVPDGTVHGAKDNGNGTFSNPPVLPPITIDAVLTRDGFIDHSISQLGGVARFGAIIYAAKSSNDPTVSAYYEKYSAITSVTKPQAQAFYTAIRAAALPGGAVMSIPEITAIVVNWPKVSA